MTPLEQTEPVVDQQPPQQRTVRQSHSQAHITYEMILDELAAVGRPMRTNELCKRLGITDRNERKAVTNRLVALVNQERVHSTSEGKGKHQRYSLPGKRRGRPPGNSRELVLVPPTQPHRPTISVDDACVGMLMGITGADSVPIAALPEVNAWMNATQSLVERLS